MINFQNGAIIFGQDGIVWIPCGQEVYKIARGTIEAKREIKCK